MCIVQTRDFDISGKTFFPFENIETIDIEILMASTPDKT